MQQVPLKFRYYDPLVKQIFYSDTFKSLALFFKEIELLRLQGLEVTIDLYTGFVESGGFDIYQNDIVQEEGKKDLYLVKTEKYTGYSPFCFYYNHFVEGIDEPNVNLWKLVSNIYQDEFSGLTIDEDLTISGLN